MTTWITICDTCRRDDMGDAGQTPPHGQALAGLIDAMTEGSALKTRRISCLMGCTHGCNVAIQAKGKMAYTLGNFTPDSDAAQAIVDYARLHAASKSGVIAYSHWPEGVKAHFISRQPPLPDEG